MIRPKPVSTAVWILYSLLGVGLAFGAIGLISSAGALWPRFWIFWLPTLLLAAGAAFVVRAAGRRQRWARITLLVFVVLQVPRFATQALDAFPLHLLSASKWLAPVIIEAFAVWLLFTPESSRWYRASDTEKEA